MYEVDADVERYRSLMLDMPAEEFRSVPGLGGVSVAAVWPTPPVHIDNFTAESPDVWTIGSMVATLVVTTSVRERLEPFLSQAGELLPLRDNTGEEWEFEALNVLNVLPLQESIDVGYRRDERLRLLEEMIADSGVGDEADLVRQSVADGDPWPYLAPAFIEEALELPSTFFRVDRLVSDLFLLERDDPDTLLRRIERLGISGLVLHRVWSSETGPMDVNLF